MRLTTISKSALAAALLSASSPKAVTAWEDSCTQFKDIYADGTELCEKMWNDSYEVVDDASRAYTMWFFNENDNPNNLVTEQLSEAPRSPTNVTCNGTTRTLPPPRETT